jgi:solute carrier family 25 (adenine nucleotide translocator) protein 4/5/6/31
MNFAFKDYYQSLFIKPKDEVGFPRYFAGYLLAGACAGASSLSISYPLEFSYTRLAADTGASGKREFSGILDCVRKTVAKDGIRGIYRGFAPSVGGIIVYRAGYFGLFDLSTDYVLPLFGISKSEQHTWTMVATKFLIALSVDIFASLCAYPLDTIRRSLMMQSGKPEGERLYRTTMECGRVIWREQGFRGLYKGAYTNSIRAFGSALVLVVFSEIKFRVTGK